MLFGAATHDIGEAVHMAELSGPGSEHETGGQALLLESGIDPPLARFAATHASWNRDDIEVEDLLVSVADNVWEATRVTALEQLLVDHLAAASQREAWQVSMDLDDHLDQLAAGADHRLQCQNRYPRREGRREWLAQTQSRWLHLKSRQAPRQRALESLSRARPGR